jgi:cytochrome b561
MLYNSPGQYGVVSKLLHGVIALLMPVMISVGYYMTTLSDQDPLYFRLLDLHQTTGLFLFCLFLIKFTWRFISPNPALPVSLSSGERRLASGVHFVLVAALLVLPLLGYLFAVSQGDGVPVYGLFEVPSLVELDKAGADAVIDLHAILAYGVGALIVVHISAALKHHFIDKTDSLARIWR